MSNETNMTLLNSLFSMTLSVSDRDTPDFRRVIDNVVRSGCLRSSLDPDLGPIGVYRTETLTHLFELALYIASKDRVRAELTYAKLLQTANLPASKYVDDELSTIDGDDGDSYDDMPPLVPFTETYTIPVTAPAPATATAQTAPIELVISEVANDGPGDTLFENITKGTKLKVEEEEAVEDEDDLAEEAAEDEEAGDDVAEDEVEEEEAAEDDVADDEVAEDDVAEDDVEEEEAAEDEVEEEEEVVELDLEPVRIKKIIYWKDVNSGDIYESLPDDEVGDKVGQYVDGKPVFETRL